MTGQFEHFQAFDGAGFYLEAEGGAYQLPALQAGGSGVHRKHIELVVPLYLQDMRVPADEQSGLHLHYRPPGHLTVVAGISPDVGHQHFQPLAIEALKLREVVAGGIPVAVAMYPYHRLEVLDTLEESFIATQITGVPELIHGLQELAELGAENPVRIRYKTYIHGTSDSIQAMASSSGVSVLTSGLTGSSQKTSPVRAISPAIVIKSM